MNDIFCFQGDSGGPLQVKKENDYYPIYSVVGVTSFGKACGIKNVPGVYTRVSQYIPWIENIVWPQNNNIQNVTDPVLVQKI